MPRTHCRKVFDFSNVGFRDEIPVLFCLRIVWRAFGNIEFAPSATYWGLRDFVALSEISFDLFDLRNSFDNIANSAGQMFRVLSNVLFLRSRYSVPVRFFSSSC